MSMGSGGIFGRKRPLMFDPNNPGATMMISGRPEIMPQQGGGGMAGWNKALQIGRDKAKAFYSGEPLLGETDGFGQPIISQSGELDGYGQPVGQPSGGNTSGPVMDDGRQNLPPSAMFDPANLPQQPQQQGTPRKRGIFGSGIRIADVLGAFGDAFSDRGPVYGPMKQRERESLMEAEQRRQQAEMQQQQRMDDRQYDANEWTRRQQWERDNPKPTNNDTVNDLNWYKSLSEEDRKLFHQMKPTITYRADGTPVAINPYDLQQPEFAGWPEDEGGPVQQAPGNFPGRLP